MLDGRLQLLFPLVAGPNGAGHKHTKVQDAACDVIVLLGRLYGPEPVLTSLTTFAGSSGGGQNQVGGTQSLQVGGGIRPNVLKKIVVAFDLKSEQEEAEEGPAAAAAAAAAKPGLQQEQQQKMGPESMESAMAPSGGEKPGSGLQGSTFNYDRAPPSWDPAVGSTKAPQWNHYRVL
jgi:hypothetical protein